MEDELKIAEFETADAALDAVRECLMAQLETIEAKFGLPAAVVAGKWIASELFIESSRVAQSSLEEAQALIASSWTVHESNDPDAGEVKH